MNSGDFLQIQPTDALEFPFKLGKQCSCGMQLTNKTNQYVAFRVRVTNPSNYCVRPNNGMIFPGGTCDVTVTKQAENEAPPDMKCEDKFLIQSVVVAHGATPKDITPEMFTKNPDKAVQELKLLVVYIPANPPSPDPEELEEGSSPDPEELEEGSSPRSAATENGTQRSSLLYSKKKRSSLFALVTRLFRRLPKDQAVEPNAFDMLINEELAREKLVVEQLTTENDQLKIKYNKKLAVEHSIQQELLEAQKLVKEKDTELMELKERYEGDIKTLNLELMELKKKYDDVVKEVEEIRQKENLAKRNSIQELKIISKFSESQILQATKNFSDVHRIGKGGYATVYKGLHENTDIAIKRLDPQSTQGPIQFWTEVDVLRKVRHPNIVTLFGTCQELCVLIYEFLPNGSLADRLTCKNDTPPLTWRARSRITFEICSALIYLHSCDPPIVHGDLKPENILLDSNLVSKLGDFGISRILLEFSPSGTIYHETDNPKGTFPYMDPEFIYKKRLTALSDVYSFGIVILVLVTGMSPMNISEKVKKARDNKKFHTIVDPTAGDWPYVQAKGLVNLGMKCCDKNPKNRPNLTREVLCELEAMLMVDSLPSFA